MKYQRERPGRPGRDRCRGGGGWWCVSLVWSGRTWTSGCTRWDTAGRWSALSCSPIWGQRCARRGDTTSPEAFNRSYKVIIYSFTLTGDKGGREKSTFIVHHTLSGKEISKTIILASWGQHKQAITTLIYYIIIFSLWVHHNEWNLSHCTLSFDLL